MQQAMLDNVHEVVAFGAGHGIGDACHLGGTISLARTQPQIERLKARLAELERFGFAADYEWLGADEARRACNATDVLGAIRTRTCATVHPLRLTHAVARAADAAGVRILEHTAVEEIRPRQLTTSGGTVHAEIVVRATEGYTAQFAGEHRALLPIYSLMIATEPLGDDGVGRDRSRRPTDVPRRPAPDHLRPAHHRRADRLRRARRAVSLRFEGAAGIRHRRGRARTPHRRPARAVPRAAGRGDHPPLGRRAGGSPRLDTLRPLRQVGRASQPPAAMSAMASPPPISPDARWRH